jgi:threonine synthase
MQLRGIDTGKIYRPADVVFTAPRGRGATPDELLDVEYDYERIRSTLTRETLAAAPPSLWRYLPLLPLEGRRLPVVQAGWTPIYPLDRLARRHGLGALWVKDEGRNPTASFKDRASQVGALCAEELGHATIACASTGNAASSLAGIAAHLGLTAFIFVPAAAPEAKVAQLRIFRSRVLLVEGSYEEAYELCQAAVSAFGWYNRNCAVNPVLVEGKKTGGLEAAEQLGGRVPDWVAVSVGDGCTLAGIWKGFFEMYTLGFIERLPRLLGVQAAGACPVHDAFQAGRPDVTPRAVATLADSIAVGHPRNAKKALRALAASHGETVAVADEQILAAMYELASEGGVFGEPAGVAGWAGVVKARQAGIIREGESVLTYVTGSGLKDVRAAMRACPEATRIRPHLYEVRRVLSPEVAS